MKKLRIIKTRQKNGQEFFKIEQRLMGIIWMTFKWREFIPFIAEDGVTCSPPPFTSKEETEAWIGKNIARPVRICPGYILLS